VKPRKQRALAKAHQAHVLELEGDHLCTLDQPRAFSAGTLALVDHLTGRVPAAQTPTHLDEPTERLVGEPAVD
jgi:hypothetical protein